MPMLAITTGIIHIEIDCSPVKSNSVVLIGIDVPPAVVVNPKENTVTITKTSNVALPLLTPN